ncbi:hypothetical protein BDV18DRAFT_163737 [Aspergillus unguis]
MPRNVSPSRRRRRAPVTWDHRKDKYMLLAIFSQLKIRGTDYQKLADTLGNDAYTAGNLERRFRELRQMAAEVYEDRQDQQAQALRPASPEVQDDNVVEEPATQPPPLPVPSTPTPARQPTPAVPKPTPPPSNILVTAARPRKSRAKTAPPASQAQDSSPSQMQGKERDNALDITPGSDERPHKDGKKRKSMHKVCKKHNASKNIEENDSRHKKSRKHSKTPDKSLQQSSRISKSSPTPGPVTPRSTPPRATRLCFDEDMSIIDPSEAPLQHSIGEANRAVGTNARWPNGAPPKGSKRPWRQAHYGRPYEAEYEEGYDEFVFATTGEF